MTLTILKLLPFAFFSLLILFGGHYFLYRSLARFFDLTNARLKTLLRIIFFSLPAVFMIIMRTTGPPEIPVIKLK